MKIVWSDEDSAFVAKSAIYPGAAGRGPTPEDAERALHAEIDCRCQVWIENLDPGEHHAS
jgi:hypothetical protein